jgi:flagellar basal body rod protein FlgG
MNPVSSIALSSMSVASARLARSAHNVANVNTDGYEAERSVVREARNGGVTSSSEPTHAQHPTFERGADEVLGSNTDLISEQVEQLGAVQQFKASIALLKTDQEMTQSVLDLKA